MHAHSVTVFIEFFTRLAMRALEAGFASLLYGYRGICGYFARATRGFSAYLFVELHFPSA